MTSTKLSPAASVVAYTAFLLALSLVVGVVRTLARYAEGSLLSHYLVHSVIVNGLLMFLCSLIVTPVYPALRAGLGRVAGRSREGDIAAGASSALAYLAFWALNSEINRRVLRELWTGNAGPVFEEVSRWAPGLFGIAILGWWLFARGRSRPVLARCAGVSGLMLVGASVLWIHSTLVNPSNVAPPDVQASARRKPDIFLVLVDTLRADHLSVYGYAKPTSPNVDALARDGTVYEKSFAPAPWTRPSCGTLLTSRHPQELGLKGFRDVLPPDVPILPEFLKVEGYRTAGIVSSVQVSAQFGFDKGFGLLDTGPTFLKFTGNMRAVRRLKLEDGRDNYPRYNAEELTDRALEWIEKGESNRKPLFMYLHYSDPHYPYLPPPEQDRWEEFATKAALEWGRPVVPPRRSYDASTGEITWSGKVPTEPEVDSMIARYDAEIAYFDSHFGRLVKFLKETGRYEDSMIIVTSDHGEEFGEHGGWRHDHSLYNELLHVPMVIKYPFRVAALRGRREATLTGLIDVLPTIQGVLGAKWPSSGFRGRSLLEGRISRENQEIPIYARSDRPPLRALYRGKDKLIQHLGTRGEVVGESYFSLDENFRERGDGGIEGATPGISKERLGAMRRTLEAIDSMETPSRKIELDQETLKELRALGYIQ